MKREIRSMEVGTNKINCDIIFAKCSCLVGESGYCNNIMALLFEIADYSLHQLFQYLKKIYALAWLQDDVYHQQIYQENNQL